MRGKKTHERCSPRLVLRVQQSARTERKLSCKVDFFIGNWRNSAWLRSTLKDEISSVHLPVVEITNAAPRHPQAKPFIFNRERREKKVQPEEPMESSKQGTPYLGSLQHRNHELVRPAGLEPATCAKRAFFA